MKVPNLRKHKASGRAVVTLHNRDYYCGVWGSAESQKNYRRIISDYVSGTLKKTPVNEVLVLEVIAACLKELKQESPARVHDEARLACKLLVEPKKSS